nr:hypothetical protein [Tanacetum cinerariifolium]
MSSASYAVTYTSVYIDSKPGRVFWGSDEELSDEVTYTSVYIDSKPGRVFWGSDEELSDEEPIYPEYIPVEDEHILPTEEQPLPPVVSPTAESPGYVAESDLEEDPKEYEEDEIEDGPDEHLASIDSAVVIPIDEIVSPPEGTEPIIPPPSTDTATTGARITIRPQTSISLPPEAERLARCTALATLPSPLLPPSLYPPHVDRGDDILESEQPPRKRLCLSTLGTRYEVGESSTRGRRVDYGFADTVEVEMRHRGIREVWYRIRDTWIDPAEAVPKMIDMLYWRTPRTVGLAYHSGLPWTNTLLRNSTDGDRSQSSHKDNPRHVQTTRPCFYADFMKCHPLNFKGNEGVVGLTRWIKKMESVFNISGCTIENQVKFATCTLLDAALTWWNSQIRTLGLEAYAMNWEVLKKKMTDKYCPQGELKKLEIELWNLKVKGNDVPTYTNHFQELTLIYTKFIANENEKINKYISRLSDNIYGNVKSSKPRTLDETIELTNDLRDQKLHTYVERADNKRKTDDTDGKETPKGNGCFKCGASGHFKKDYPKLKNKNGGNKNAQGWVYEVRNTEKNMNAPMNPDSNVVTIFMTQISAKKEEDKSKGKQLKDVPIVRDFPNVFLEDFPGLPPVRPVEF